MEGHDIDTVEVFDSTKGGRLVVWKVKPGGFVKKGHVILDYMEEGEGGKTVKYKCQESGVVKELLVKKGDTLIPRCKLLSLRSCTHPTVITDLCAVCGVDFRRSEGAKPIGASVSMIHTVPDLRCSLQEAKEISKTEENRLLKQRKLHLLVDLDQTLIHTTNMDVPPTLEDVFHFRLPGSPLTYHTRLRPGTRPFLNKISNLYELHICTFGSRNYAHSIARYLDPEGKYFYIRILSRDECFNPNSKTANLQELFPSGDHMVCIIDDREDVWNFTPNLIHVKPYHFFSKTGDINAPPALAKQEDDNKSGIEFTIDGAVKQIEKEKPKIEQVEEETPQVKKKEEQENLKEDLKLSDESDNTSTSTSSTSDMQTEASTPKPDVPPVFEESVTTDQEQQIDKEIEVKEDKNEETAAVVEKEPSPDAADVTTVDEKEAKVGEMMITEDKKEVVADADDYLLYLEDILERIHGAFYKEFDTLQTSGSTQLPNVKEIVPNLRKTVLKDCSIVFSGVVPVGAKLEASRAYAVATNLGAFVSDRFIPPSKPGSSSVRPTTHVVAARLGTAKTNEARRYKGVHIVTPDWLWSCAERWDHVEEKLFTLGKKSTIRRHPPQYLTSEGSNQSEEDVFLSNAEVVNDFNNSAIPDTNPGADASGGSSGVVIPGARRVRTLSGRFMDTINPLLSFSMDEIASMDHEVDDILSASSSDDDENPKPKSKNLRRKRSRPLEQHQIIHYANHKSKSSSDSSDDDEESNKRRRLDLPPETDEPEEEESLFTKFRRGEPLPSDAEILNLTNQSTDEDNNEGDNEENEWMARQLEAELLGEDSSQDPDQ